MKALTDHRLRSRSNHRSRSRPGYALRSNCGSFVPPAAYPAIRGVMTWSINWDASNGYNFAGTVAPYLATLP
jgi:chitinase